MRKALAEKGVLDRSRKIRSDESHVYLPVLETYAATRDELGQIAAFEPVQIDFLPEVHPIAPEDILGYRPSFEVVGDIALVEEADAEAVAAALMATSKGIKAVIAAVSDVEGEFRTRRFRHVAGEARTTTVHKEHGLRYRVDLEGAYFTERLGTRGFESPNWFCRDFVLICSQVLGHSLCSWPGRGPGSWPWTRTP